MMNKPNIMLKNLSTFENFKKNFKKIHCGTSDGSLLLNCNIKKIPLLPPTH